jgi:hypothetical protein
MMAVSSVREILLNYITLFQLHHVRVLFLEYTTEAKSQ